MAEATSASIATPPINDVSLKDAFDIYQKQSDSVHKLWAYFQVVSIAVLGYTVGTDKTVWSSWTYVFISASYFFFAIANQWVLVLSQSELKVFSKAVNAASEKTSQIGKLLKVTAVSPGRVKAFHTLSAIVVLVAIVFTWHDKCTGQWSCPKPPLETKTTCPSGKSA